MRADHPAALVQEPREQRRRDAIRRASDDVERPARQAQIGCIRAYDEGPVTEALAQMGQPLRMDLDGDHPRAGGHEGFGDGAEPGTYVQDEIARSDLRISDEGPGPVAVELVPSPCPP